MPMYFPDLASVRACALVMATKQSPENLYKGIIPETDDDLPLARKQLAVYFRKVWQDEIQAIEIEEALDESNYDEVMSQRVKNSFLEFFT